MKELITARHTWDRGTVGDGTGYSSKLSIKLLWEPRDLWLGVYWTRDSDSATVYICLLPCLPIRIKRVRSYGGKFPRKRLWFPRKRPAQPTDAIPEEGE